MSHFSGSTFDFRVDQVYGLSFECIHFKGINEKWPF